MSSYLKEHNLVTDQQSGYLTGYSAQTLLLKLVEDIRHALMTVYFFTVYFTLKTKSKNQNKGKQ